LGVNKTLNLAIAMNESKYEGKLFVIGEDMTYELDSDLYPVLTIGDKSYRSQNRLLTSDNWATQSTGTNGDNHPTKLDMAMLSVAFGPAVLHPDVPADDAWGFGVRWLRDKVGAVYHERNSSVTEARHRTEAVRTCLDMGECVVEFPERDPMPYRWQLGELSDRPFFLAAVLDAPIIPVVLAPRVTRALNGFVRRKPGFELRIGTPVWLDRTLRAREAESQFRRDVERQMRDLLAPE
jgi:hypothetical protein